MTTTKDRMGVMVPAHPLAVKIWCIQFERFESPNYIWESEQLMASTKGYSYEKGSGLFKNQQRKIC